MKITPTLVLLLFTFSLSAQSSQNMHLLSNWDPGYTFNDIWGYADGGKEYAVIGSLSRISIVDVTDPINVSLVGEVTPGLSSVWRDVKSFNNFIYGVSEANGEGLVVIDASGFDLSLIHI